MGGRDTAGRHVFNETDNETWPHALFSLRLSGRQAARSRAVPLTVPCTRLRRLSYTPQLFHHSQNSQSIYIYDREIGAKISVSVSISRFLRLENILYLTLTLALTLSRCCRTRCAPSWSATATASRPKDGEASSHNTDGSSPLSVSADQHHSSPATSRAWRVVQVQRRGRRYSSTLRADARPFVPAQRA